VSAPVLQGRRLESFREPGKCLQQSGVRVAADDIIVTSRPSRTASRLASGLLRTLPCPSAITASALALQLTLGGRFPIEVGILIVGSLATHVGKARTSSPGFTFIGQ